MTQNASSLPAAVGPAEGPEREREGPAPKRYHPALVLLHWAIVVLIFATAYFVLVAGGEGRRQFGLTIAGLPTIGIHMILGLTVLVLLIVRLVIRLTTRHPDWATAGNRFLDVIGVLTHWGLYILTFSITITGLILALQTNRLSRVFNPSSVDRGNFAFRQSQSGQAPPAGGFQPGQSPRSGQFRPGGNRPGGFEGGFPAAGGFFLGAFHGLSWTLLLLLLVVHVGASLYHQFIRKDGLFGRMWFGRRYA
jgi:cytochrome b561